MVLEVDSIEEHYPKQLVLKAMKEEFGIEVSEEELENTKAISIERVLVEKGRKLNNWWKPLLGRKVAEMMKEEDIPVEIRRLIERITLVLS